MNIAKIFFSNFRNFAELNLNLDAAVNIFLGKNAQGKTNILEAINFISLGRSRATKDFELVRWNQDTALIRINFSKADVSHNLAVEISADKRRRRILFEGNSIKFRDLIGKLNSVLFSPEDLFMFKGAPAARRKFLDGTIAQASPIFFIELTNYNRLIDQRNNLLKKIREGLTAPNNLEIWNEQLAAAAAKVTIRRRAALDKLNVLADFMQQKISAQTENLSIAYDMHGLQDLSPPQNFNADYLSDWYYKNFKARNYFDIKRGSTSLGPHLDDLQFFINGKEIRQYGSQGQIRTATLALKLSELQLLKDATGEYPILLLDDVMSELDAERREQLLAFLLREKIQTLITATEKAYFPAQIAAKIFYVESGTVRENL